MVVGSIGFHISPVLSIPLQIKWLPMVYAFACCEEAARIERIIKIESIATLHWKNRFFDFLIRINIFWRHHLRKSRYILTNEATPIHPNGREFFYPESYKGYTIETHYARDRAMKVLSDLCEKLELEFEAIDT